MEGLPKKYKFVLGEESHMPFQMPLRYIRRLLVCAFLASGLGEFQVMAITSANFLMLAFYGVFWPSKSSFSNWINLLIEICYLGLGLTLVLYVNAFNLSTDSRLNFGNAMIAFSVAALLLIVIWMIWEFLLFLYEFQFVRNIVEETKLANRVYPEQDNLRL